MSQQFPHSDVDTATTTTIASSEAYLLSSAIVPPQLWFWPQMPGVQRHPEKPANSSVLGQRIQASVVGFPQVNGHVRQCRT